MAAANGASCCRSARQASDRRLRQGRSEASPWEAPRGEATRGKRRRGGRREAAVAASIGVGVAGGQRVRASRVGTGNW